MRPNALACASEEKKLRRVRVLDLTESNPTKCGFKPPDLTPLSDPANLLYDPDPRGLLSAREAVCAYYASKRIPVRPDRVFLTSGTSEAYSYLFHLLCSPGDEVLCRMPVYPLLDHLAEYARIGVRRFSDLDAVRAPLVGAQNGRAQGPPLLTLVNPNNPTGKYVSENEWEIVDKFCAKNGAAVLSDEVFFDFNWSQEARVSGASRVAGLHFTLNGVSKMLGLPQMKLAWIVLSGPDKQCRDVAGKLELIADSFLSVNTPAQTALPSWLARKDAFVAEVMERVKINFKMLCDAVGAGLVPARPEGGWYAVLPLPKGVDDEKFALRLLEEQDVLLHPGYFFDLEEQSVVISLLPEIPVFTEATRRLIKLI